MEIIIHFPKFEMQLTLVLIKTTKEYYPFHSSKTWTLWNGRGSLSCIDEETTKHTKIKNRYNAKYVKRETKAKKGKSKKK